MEIVKIGSSEELHFFPDTDDFDAITKVLPAMRNIDELRSLEGDLASEVRKSCGRSPRCTGSIAVKSQNIGDSLGDGATYRVKDVYVECTQQECPLSPPDNGGGEAGDWEPVNPSPVPPTLQAEVEPPYVYDETPATPVMLPVGR